MKHDHETKLKLDVTTMGQIEFSFLGELSL